jgi:hypothetical protein
MRAAAAAGIDVERIARRKRPIPKPHGSGGWVHCKYNAEATNRLTVSGGAMRLAQSSSVAPSALCKPAKRPLQRRLIVINNKFTRAGEFRAQRQRRAPPTTTNNNQHQRKNNCRDCVGAALVAALFAACRCAYRGRPQGAPLRRRGSHIIACDLPERPCAGTLLKIQGGNREPRLWPRASGDRFAGRADMHRGSGLRSVH